MAAKKASSKKPFGNIKKGALHKELGVAQDKKIPAGKAAKELAKLKATKHKSKAQVTEERRLVFAENAKKFKHGKGK